MDCSPPGSSVHGIFQARVREWVAIFSSRDIPDPGIEPGSPTSQADALPSEPPGNIMKYYSAIKGNEALMHATTWTNLESIMLSERSQTQKTPYCMISFI